MKIAKNSSKQPKMETCIEIKSKCSIYLRVLQQLLFASYEQWVNNPLKKSKQNLFANGKIAITGL